jgi:hypothetical protein
MEPKPLGLAQKWLAKTFEAITTAQPGKIAEVLIRLANDAFHDDVAAELAMEAIDRRSELDREQIERLSAKIAGMRHYQRRNTGKIKTVEVGEMQDSSKPEEFEPINGGMDVGKGRQKKKGFPFEGEVLDYNARLALHGEGTLKRRLVEILNEFDSPRAIFELQAIIAERHGETGASKENISRTLHLLKDAGLAMIDEHARGGFGVHLWKRTPYDKPIKITLNDYASQEEASTSH